MILDDSCNNNIYIEQMLENSKKERLVIVISRHQLDHSLIPPLSKIFAALSLLVPTSLYTSLKCAERQIHPNKSGSLYIPLVEHLRTTSGECDVNSILFHILQHHLSKGQSFRVCVIGNENIDWSIVMDYKRKSVIIDTIGHNQQLFQISYVTGGIHKNVNENQMLKVFLTQFSIGSKNRKLFKPDTQKNIEFSLKCTCCDEEVKQDFKACPVCLAPYGHLETLGRKLNGRCLACGNDFMNN